MWPTRVWKWCPLREIRVILNLLCPAIILASLSPLSFHTEVCMNNVCHIASPSLKVTLVNYWSGHMITDLTSVCSRLALGSGSMSALFFFLFFIFLETLIWWITVYYYCWCVVGNVQSVGNFQYINPDRVIRLNPCRGLFRNRDRLALKCPAYYCTADK